MSYYKVTVTHYHDNHEKPIGQIFTSSYSLDQVRQDFNPSGDKEVDFAKILAAASIEHVNVNGKDPRLTALAKTTAEEAAMWAVKSLTADK